MKYLGKFSSRHGIVSMHYLTNLKAVTQTSLVIIFIALFFVSCSSFNFKKSPENKDNAEQISEQNKVASLEAELADIKNDQTDIKLQIKNKNSTIDKLQGQIKVLERKITYLGRAETKHLNPADLYKKARNLLIEENYIVAADIFTDFITRFPENELAGNAAYWLGECYYSLNQYKKAITVFKFLVTEYPKSGKVPGAILKTGYAYISLDDSNRAHHYLKTVLKKYPFSPAAEKAQEKLKTFE
jgi:tol-pal system protein YbgF